MPDKPFPWGKALTLVLVAAWMLITVIQMVRGPSQANPHLGAYDDER